MEDDDISDAEFLEYMEINYVDFDDLQSVNISEYFSNPHKEKLDSDEMRVANKLVSFGHSV